VNGNASWDNRKEYRRVSKLVGDIAIGRPRERSESQRRQGAVKLSGEFHRNVSLARIARR